MICPVCFKKEATKEVVRYFGAYESKGVVCADCLDFAYLLDANGFYNVFYANLQHSCPRCGRTLGQILNTLIVGCPNCYQEFAKEFKPLIDSLQGRDNK